MTANRATLLALASRVEVATGADSGLDSEIHHAILNGVGVGSYGAQPVYTSSLDAAMSLVPSGCFGAQVSSHTDCTGGATCWDSRGNPYSVNAATPALALTAACLRARAMLEQDNG